MRPKELCNLLLFCWSCLHLNGVGANIIPVTPGRAIEAGDAVLEGTKAVQAIDLTGQSSKALGDGLHSTTSLKAEDLTTFRDSTTEVDKGLSKTTDPAISEESSSSMALVVSKNQGEPIPSTALVLGKNSETDDGFRYISTNRKMSFYERLRLKAWKLFVKQLKKKKTNKPKKTGFRVPKGEEAARAGRMRPKPNPTTNPEQKPPTKAQRVWKAIKDWLGSLQKGLRQSEGLIPTLIRKLFTRTRPATVPSV